MADKNIVVNMNEAVLKRLHPAITRWNRLEGRPRTHHFDRALRAEVRDALWMLSRQWQLGEFQGDDAGSPVLARLCMDVSRIDRFQAGTGAVEPLRLDEPLEARVERRPVPLRLGAQYLSLDLRLAAGRRWLKLLERERAAGRLSADYRAAYRTRYAVPVPDPTQAAQAMVCAPPANTTYRVYYYAGGQPIAMRVMPPNYATGTVHYLLSDHLGSMSASVDPNLNVTRQYFYPYGGVRSGSGTLPTAKGFTGQLADATGLMYFNARYYSQTLGRFVSADTIVPEPGDPQAFNRYAFVFNNPLKYYDPSGHASIPSCAGKPDCGIKDDPPQPPPDPCKVLGLLCKPPSSPISEADEIYEFGTSTLVLQIGPGGVTIHMTSGQNKGGSVRAKLGQLLLKVLPPGSAAAEWIRRIVCGGDCSDEVQTVINQIQRLPVPPTPGGITVSEFGQKVMQWGTGSEAARARISTITAEELRKAQLTVDMAIRWRDFYINELARNPNNPSAAGRAELMDYVVRLLGGK